VGLAGQRGAGRLRPGGQRVDLGLVGDRVADAEFAAARRADRDAGVLGQLGARVEAKLRPPCSSNIATAPAGLVASPANSVPTTPGVCRPSPSR
jgi:hypothetical protein